MWEVQRELVWPLSRGSGGTAGSFQSYPSRAVAEIRFLTVCKHTVVLGLLREEQVGLLLGELILLPLLSFASSGFITLAIIHARFLLYSSQHQILSLMDWSCIAQFPQPFSLGRHCPEPTTPEVSEYSSKARHNHSIETPHLCGPMGFRDADNYRPSKTRGVFFPKCVQGEKD